jgi:hypothetical protein
MKFMMQELKKAHNALGMVNRFTFALLRAELSANEGVAPSITKFLILKI